MKKNLRVTLILIVFGVIAKAQIGDVDLNFNGVWPAGSFGAAATPSLWVTTNLLTSPLVSTSNPTTITQSSVNCDSPFSMKIETAYFPVNSSLISAYVPDTSGFAFTGSINFGTTVQIKDGFVYTQRPNKFMYCVETVPAAGDTSGIRLILWKWTGTNRNIIGFAEERYTSANPVTSMSSRTLNVAYTSTLTPDSACVYIGSSFKFPNSGIIVRKGAKPGSRITVDKIELGINIGVNENELNLIPLTVFPNPSNGSEVAFKTESDLASYYIIRDLMGKEVKRGNFENGTAKIQTKILAEGIYLYNVFGTEQQLLKTGKLIFNQ
jgi:hypothetical protein